MGSPGVHAGEDVTTDNQWADVPESDGKAKFVITVKGGTLSAESRDLLVDELRELADENNDKHVLLIEPEHLIDAHGMTDVDIDVQVLR